MIEETPPVPAELKIEETVEIPRTGRRMPIIGLGTWHNDENGQPRSKSKALAVCGKHGPIMQRDHSGGIYQLALDIGYRQLDTARSFRTEHAVSIAVDLHHIPRTDVFITTKTDQVGATPEATRDILLESIQNAGGDRGYVDLLLIDAPDAKQKHQRKMMWLELEKLYEEGKAKAIGVSNYIRRDLVELLEYATAKPHVNQLPSCGKLTQKTSGPNSAPLVHPEWLGAAAKKH